MGTPGSVQLESGCGCQHVQPAKAWPRSYHDLDRPTKTSPRHCGAARLALALDDCPIKGSKQLDDCRVWVAQLLRFCCFFVSANSSSARLLIFNIYESRNRHCISHHQSVSQRRSIAWSLGVDLFRCSVIFDLSGSNASGKQRILCNWFFDDLMKGFRHKWDIDLWVLWVSVLVQKNIVCSRDNWNIVGDHLCLCSLAWTS